MDVMLVSAGALTGFLVGLTGVGGVSQSIKTSTIVLKISMIVLNLPYVTCPFHFYRPSGPLVSLAFWSAGAVFFLE